MNDLSSPVGAEIADALSPNTIERVEAGQKSLGAMVNLTLNEELLAVIPLVRRIVRHNLRGSLRRQATEDVEQQVLLALWQWRWRNLEQKLTTIEMEKIAARSAKRGALAYYRKQMRNTTDPQVDFDNNADKNRSNFNHQDDGETFYAGQTVFSAGDEAEAALLAKFLFRAIEKLSLRQRFALLLQKSELIVHLLTAEACRIGDLAAALEMSKTEFLNALRSLPLSDEQIGELWRVKTGEKLTAKQV